MRTTIVLDDALGSRLRSLVPKKGLSEFINQCLREHFARMERVRRLKALEKAYGRAAKTKETSVAFDTVDREEWPEW